MNHFSVLVLKFSMHFRPASPAARLAGSHRLGATASLQNDGSCGADRSGWPWRGSCCSSCRPLRGSDHEVDRGQTGSGRADQHFYPFYNQQCVRDVLPGPGRYHPRDCNRVSQVRGQNRPEGYHRRPHIAASRRAPHGDAAVAGS